MNFCHLHVHNQYSLLDGFGTAEAYASYARSIEFEYIALTNHGNIDGLINWQKACKKEGIKPILGVEMYVVPNHLEHEKGEKRGHLVVLIKNQRGFENVCSMLTEANVRGFYHRPTISPSLLLNHLEGIVVMSACMGTFMTYNWGFELFHILREEIPDDLYLEIMPHYDEDQISVNKFMFGLSGKYGLPLVATNDCHYIKRHQWKAQEVLLAINSNKRWNDPDRFKFQFRGLHLRTENEMKVAFQRQGALMRKVYEEAICNTMVIARKCSGFEIKKRAMDLPKLDTNISHSDLLYNLCIDAVHSLDVSDRMKVVYRHRFIKEYNLIIRKKFESYFILVYNIINFADQNGIGRGPGRGSVGCCLLAHLLDITDIDPIRYGLPVDRFISEDRIDFPDIDIDFEDTKTDMIRSYLEEEFGEENVFGISTFARLQGKAVIRDVSKVFEVPRSEVDEFAKSVERNVQKGESNAIREAISNTDKGKQFYKRYPEVVDIAMELEGQIRHASKHASAIIITSNRLDGVGVQTLRKKNLACNWDMDDAEYMGLVKIDILGLNNMTVLCEAAKLIKKNRNHTINFKELSFDDGEVYELLRGGDVAGCFQVSGRSTKKVVEDVGVDSFLSLSDAIALSRPGPKDSGMTEQYIRRRDGVRWERKHNLFEKETEDTYGVIVYQEQVMGVLRSVAGFSYSEADKVRKVISKKLSRKGFDPFKDSFIRGATKKGTMQDEEAEDFWFGLTEDTRYSFNKAHSLGYAMIAYWDAYLKKYYPLEFTCSLLTHGSRSDKGKEDKRQVLEEAKKQGLIVMPPKIGISDGKEWVVKDDKIYIPFIEIDGIGDESLPLIEESSKGIRSGWFGDFSPISAKRGQTRIENVLSSISAREPEYIPPDISKYIKKYDIFSYPVKVNGTRFKIDKSLLRCDDCDLRFECTRPVLPSPGKYNVIVSGEAPGPEEDEDGEGFIGKAGVLLWKEFEKYGLKRRYFHITNNNKCYPKNSKNPNLEQAKICYDLWLTKEIEAIECELLLAFGNISRYAFTGIAKGVRSVSGSTQMFKFKHGPMKVVWSVHPAAVLRGDDLNKIAFEKGVKKFVEELRGSNGFNEILY